MSVLLLVTRYYFGSWWYVDGSGHSTRKYKGQRGCQIFFKQTDTGGQLSSFNSGWHSMMISWSLLLPGMVSAPFVFPLCCNRWCVLTIPPHEDIANTRTAPSLRTCGHTYCAKCISKEFRTQLVKNLTKFSRQKNIFPCLTVSDTQRELQDRISCIRRHGGLVSQVFVYSCPVCRQLTTEPPVLCRGLEGILQAACDILDLSISDLPHAGSFRRRDIFVGLFA